MSDMSPLSQKFVLGLDAGIFGRWARLILGAVVPLYAILSTMLSEQPSLNFFGGTVIYFAVILAVYLTVHYFLGERFFTRLNPWWNTLILVGPPVCVLVLRLGPNAFQLALALYIAISLIFNFVMSYGGCEVSAIPSLILRRRYVVYCPWNVVDAVDKVIAERKIANQ